MQTSISVIFASFFQLLLLIAGVNATVFMHNRRKARYSAVDVLLPVMQAANLIMLLQYLKGYDRLYTAENGNNALFFVIQALFAFLILIRYVWLLRKEYAHSGNLLTSQSIRETIDYLPSGISLSAPNGKPILTNYRMNQLVYQLTGHTIINARAVWEELSQAGNKNGFIKQGSILIDGGRTGEPEEDSIYFLLPDDRIWRFRKHELTDQTPYYIQVEATDITELYRYSKELYENNKTLEEQNKRQRSLLAIIVKINHEK